jgi:hypothetical protein
LFGAHLRPDGTRIETSDINVFVGRLGDGRLRSNVDPVGQLRSHHLRCSRGPCERLQDCVGPRARLSLRRSSKASRPISLALPASASLAGWRSRPRSSTRDM